MVINKYKILIILFSLVFSLYAFFLDPGSDQYDLGRHHAHIENIKELSYNEVIEQSRVGYILFDSYAWILNTLELSKHLLVTTAVFLTYLLVFTVYYKFSEVYKTRILSRQTKILLFLMFWLSIGYVSVASGIRNSFSNAIVFFVSFYLLYFDKRAMFIFGVILAFFIHPFALAPSIVVLTVYFTQSIKNKVFLGKLLILIGLVFLLNPQVLAFIFDLIKYLMSGFSFFKPSYLDLEGVWGAGHDSTRNFNGLLEVYFFSKLPFYLGLVYLLFIPTRAVKDKKLYFLLSVFFLYFLIFINFYTLVNRMNNAFILFLTLFFAIQQVSSHNKCDKYISLMYLICLLIYSVFNIYSYRYFFLTAF